MRQVAGGHEGRTAVALTVPSERGTSVRGDGLNEAGDATP